MVRGVRPLHVHEPFAVRVVHRRPPERLAGRHHLRHIRLEEQDKTASSRTSGFGEQSLPVEASSSIVSEYFSNIHVCDVKRLTIERHFFRAIQAHRKSASRLFRS